LARPKTNIAHSVGQRLLQIHRDTGERNEYLLQRYGVERFLYRLSISRHASVFVLKGASLFHVWQGKGHRATKDIELLGSGDPSIARMTTIFLELCQMDTLHQDGLIFDDGSILVSKIKEDQEYEGVRIILSANLERARISVQVDIGFGDEVSPAPERIVFPVMLDAPAPELNAYPKETVFAEKFHAMVYRGMDNSRMKDFYDIAVMIRIFSWEEKMLSTAIRHTFKRRETEIPTSLPIALTAAFAENPVKVAQWNGFVHRGNLSLPVGSLSEVTTELRNFFIPLLEKFKIHS
jgi:predicted nucleotidyltransferase component of viral defense system